MALKYPAETFGEAVDLAIDGANKLRDFVNGDINTTISTEEGVIPSVAKALNEASAYKTPIAWVNGEIQTDLMQPRDFNGLIYVPRTVPVTLGLSPTLGASGGWRHFGDAYLRQELSSEGGIKFVGNGAVEVKSLVGPDGLGGPDSLIDATWPVTGMMVRTLGYYTPGDGGGNDYEIVAAGTGTDDGGSYIDLSGSGLQAKGLFTSKLGLNKTMFGGSISSAISYAISSGSFVNVSGGDTVNIPSDSLNLQNCFDFLVVSPSTGSVYINIESGHQPTDGVTIFQKDLRGFEVVSDDPVVNVSPSFNPASNLFGIFQSFGPVINCLFDMQGLGVDGFNLNSASSLVIKDGAGVQNAGRTGAFVFNGSTLDAADSVIKGSRGRNLWVSGASLANVQNSDLTGGNIDHATTLYTGSVTARRASVINAQGADFSGNYQLAIYAIRGSSINCNDATFNNLNDSATALLCETGAVISAKNTTISNVGRVATSEIGGDINIQGCVATGVVVRGLQASSGSKINATGASITAASPSADYGANASENGEITINQGYLSGFDVPIRAFAGSRVYARQSDLSVATNRSTVDQFSQIWAHQSTTLNSSVSGTPNVLDFNVSSFNTIFAPGAVWS